jgi:opacity protein-like surface antigen
MKRWFLCTMILTLSLATLAEAEPFSGEQKAGRWDFSIMTRYSWSQDITNSDGSALAIDSDLGWGFGFSKYLKEEFKLGLMFAWHSAYYTGTIHPEDEVNNAPQTYSNVLSTSAVALVGDYTFTTNRFKPYLSGNLGWVKVNTNITSDIDSGCWYYPYVGYVCGSYVDETYGSDSFTYGLGLGARIELSPTAFLKIGYEHSWVDLESYDGNDVLRVDLGFLL